MAVNVELLQKTLAHIEAHPKLWDQTWWRTERVGCGTAYCFAGWAAMLSGAAFVRLEDRTLSNEFVIPAGGGDSIWIQTYAGQALGISSDKAMDLFNGDNTLADLRRIVGELVAEAGAR